MTTQQHKLLLKLDNLVEGHVTKRPSLQIKSPYVADVSITDKDNIGSVLSLAHSPALGCCGLCDVGAYVLMTNMPIPKNKNIDQKCKYRIYLSLLREKKEKIENNIKIEETHEIIVGVNPKLAEELVENALKMNCLSRLQNIKSYKREYAMYVENKVDSRFDFIGVDENGVPFIMEVKNVPLADYEDITAKDRKKKSYEDRCVDSKVAYFPDGYRKKSSEPVSPRALKHIQELSLIKKESATRCIMCYVIQRTDVASFQPSIIDPEYRQAVKEAMSVGVEIITLVVNWTKDGNCYFVRDDLPINPID